MKNLYRIFFMLYGGIHMIAGVLIALWPGVLNLVLSNEIDHGAGTLIGIFAAMTGLGFYGAAFQKEIKLKRLFVKLAIGANVLNGLGHVVNAVQGNSPVYMGYVGAIGVTVIIGILIILYSQLNYMQN